MANLIDNSYFTGEINLPGELLTGQFATIDSYIAKYEKDFLIKLLGYDVYKDLLANPLDYSGLIDGAEYVVNFNGEKTVKWIGLVNDEKISPIAYYVYYHFMRDLATATASIGQTVPTAENATVVSMSHKLTFAWNAMMDLYGGFTDPPIRPTAYRYLREIKPDKWLFTHMERQNLWSL